MLQVRLDHLNKTISDYQKYILNSNYEEIMTEFQTVHIGYPIKDKAFE